MRGVAFAAYVDVRFDIGILRKSFKAENIIQEGENSVFFTKAKARTSIKRPKWVHFRNIQFDIQATVARRQTDI